MRYLCGEISSPSLLTGFSEVMKVAAIIIALSFIFFLGFNLNGPSTAAASISADVMPEGIPEEQEEPVETRGLLVRVEGTITSGTSRMLRNTLEQAEEENYDFLLVEIDSPGGLLDPTLKIMSDFLESPIPIITYVAPAGAISASAGSFLLLSGHKAAMTPGTSTGAAMPVQFTPGGDQGAADEKTINFIEGHIRSVARERGRSEEIAGKFVTENLTLTADDALEETIIDVVSRSRAELLESLDGEEVQIRGETRELNTAGAELTEREMDIWERFENFLGNPQVTFLLMLVGIYGIIIGFSSPGTIVPEVGGALALILALFGLGIIEVDYLGLIMVALGIFFLVVELFTPTFGIFTTIGVALLVLGGFIFPGEPLMPPEWFANFRMLVLGIAAMSALFILVVLKKIINLRKLGSENIKGIFRDKEGVAAEKIAPQGMVRVGGEIWNARIDRSAAVDSLEKGEKVEVTGREGMILIVRPLSETGENDIEKEE